MLLGASGLLGHNVLLQLSQAGHEVVAPVRNMHSVCIEPEGCSLVERDRIDRRTLQLCATGCDAIINCIGITDMSLDSLNDYLPMNRDLCEDIIHTMKQHGIKRLVHTSTTNTIGNGTPGHPADECEPMGAPFAGSPYAESKRLGEEILLRAAIEHTDWHVVVINAGYMIGSMDVKPSSGRMLEMAYRRLLMAVPRGGKAFVPARDVAAAEVSALTRGRNGARYLVVHSQGCLTIKQIYQLQARVEGYRQRIVQLPDWAVRTAGRVGDALRHMGKRTDLCTNNVCQLLEREYYTNTHALRELQYEESTLEEAVAAFFAWRKERIVK